MTKIKLGIFIAIMAAQYLSVADMAYAGGDLSGELEGGELPEDCDVYDHCPNAYQMGCTNVSEQGDQDACMEYSVRYIGYYEISSCDECAEGYVPRVATAKIPCGAYTYTVCDIDDSSEEIYCPTGSYADGSSCQNCPMATNIYTNSARTILARGTTSDDGATSVYECFLGAGTYYDASGAFDISDTCSY